MAVTRSVGLALAVIALAACEPEEPPGADDDADPPEPVAGLTQSFGGEAGGPAGPAGAGSGA